jgi:gamma-glutamyltranspeptidase/glutathione hydrolase
MAVAPHALASQSALAVLRDGGNAIEAMVAAAATVSIAYPHMNGIGGDAFWLIAPRVGTPVAIEAAGPAAARATIAAYTEAGHDVIPIRGPLAMNTVAGAIASWDAALRISKQHGGQLSIARLLRDAGHYANDGVAVTFSQVLSTTTKLDEVAHQPGFAERFLPNGKIPEVGALFRQPKLARVFELLAKDGLDGFYRGALAEKIAEDFRSVGALLSIDDLNEYQPRVCQPLQIEVEEGTVYNMVPPTQGVISLAVLGILERSGIRAVLPDSADHIHLCVEATKQAFKLRDAYVADPAYMKVAAESLLSASRLDALAKEIRLPTALPWSGKSTTGDTVWMGVIDGNGLAASFMQSIYHETLSHAEPRSGKIQRRAIDGLRNDGRRRPTANAGRRLFACNLVQAAVAAGRVRPSLAAWPNLGKQQRYPQARKQISGCDGQRPEATRS